MASISGTINEIRRTFVGEKGETGRVDFGRPFEWTGGKGTVTTSTPIWVALDDGREAHGRYQGNKSVKLTLKNHGKPVRRVRKQA